MECPELKTADIILFHNKSVLAWFIRLFTGMHYNHAGIIINKYFYEAVEKGVTRSPLLERLNGENVLIRRFKMIAPLNLERIERFALRSEGVVKYDFKNLLWYQLWYRLTGFWIGGSSANSMICTEFVARCYSPDYEFGDNLDKISPKEILLNNDFFKIYQGKFQKI